MKKIRDMLTHGQIRQLKYYYYFTLYLLKILFNIELDVNICFVF